MVRMIESHIDEYDPTLIHTTFIVSQPIENIKITFTIGKDKWDEPIKRLLEH